MIYQKRTGAATSQNVSIDEVAVLVKKVGEEIWGKDAFTSMMSSTTQTRDVTPIKGISFGNASVRTKKIQESA